MPETLLAARDLSVRLGERDILRHVQLELRAGEIVTLIGPNGAGKTTLVRALLGLIPPTGGQVVRAPALRLGYMPQRLKLDPQLPLTLSRFLRLASRDRHAIRDALEQVGIAHLGEQPVQSLSGGEWQRALLARALLRTPNLLVLDEPAQGVDVGGQVELYQLIQDLRQRTGCGVLMVSHDLHVVMAKTDVVVCLNQHVCCQGQPEHVSNDPAFLEMFGHDIATGLAVYTHHHDHRHEVDGCVTAQGEHHHHG